MAAIILTSGCWSLDPTVSPTFWDVLFKRDINAVKLEQSEQEEANRHREQMEAERTAQERSAAEAEAARALTAHLEREIAEEHADEARAKADEALAREREAYLQAQVVQAEGDKAIKIAVAQHLTNQGRAHVGLQGVNIVLVLLAAVGVVAVGLLVLWYLTGRSMRYAE